jgi:hypothetical protein
MTDGRPAPGETQPRTLARPPGERYGGPTMRADAAAPLGAAQPVAAQPLLAQRSLVRAALFGLPTAVGIGALFAFLIGVLDLDVGLLVPAAFGGWVVGVSTRAGAWPAGRALPSRAVRGLAIALAAFAWLGGQFGAYVLSLVLRPDSSLTLDQRVAQSSFLDWLSPQLSLLQVLELLLLCGIAWYSSRPTSDAAGASPER